MTLTDEEFSLYLGEIRDAPVGRSLDFNFCNINY